MKAKLAELDCTIYGISCDTFDQGKKVVSDGGITFPIGYGFSKDAGAPLGAWWGTHPTDGEFIQPTEFLLRDKVVLGSMYAFGPIGRMKARAARAFIRHVQQER